jgi:hypothetical protein
VTARGLDEHLVGDSGRFCCEYCHSDCRKDLEVISLPRQERSSVEVDCWKLDAGRINRFPVGPGVGLFRRALGIVGFERARTTGQSSMRDMLSTTFWLKAPPTVLTPIIVVGLMRSIAATKSPWAMLVSIRLLEVEQVRPGVLKQAID